MAFFGKKKRTAAELKTQIFMLQDELRELEGSPPPKEDEPDEKKAPVAPAPAVAQQATSANNALFATLSHELRTPLNGVLGMTQLLKENHADDTRLNTLESCAQHMQSVLHTLVNLAKIQDEWGDLPEYREWVNLHDMLEQTKKNLGLRAGNRRLKIEVDHQDTRVRLRGDHDHLTHIVETALLGSLECTDLNAERDPEVLRIIWEEDDGNIKVTIENPLEVFQNNRGQRISEVSELTTGNDHSRIRMEFLYWAVTTSLLECYDGAMVASPMKAGGVRTTLAFKMESMSASPSAERPIGALSLNLASGVAPDPLLQLSFKMRVLVVEDDPINRDLMALLLQRIGQEATLAENGQKALDLLTEDSSFDLIVMDIDMPVLDGMATTRAIRMGEAGDAAAGIPITAVTAFNTLSDQSKFKRIGMNYFLSKPVLLADLRNVLLDVSRKAPEPEIPEV